MCWSRKYLDVANRLFTFVFHRITSLVIFFVLLDWLSLSTVMGYLGVRLKLSTILNRTIDVHTLIVVSERPSSFLTRGLSGGVGVLRTVSAVRLPARPLHVGRSVAAQKVPPEMGRPARGGQTQGVRIVAGGP